MILCTDVSSLGDGGGDFQLTRAPAELASLIEPVIGRWAGKRIAFAGDYTHNDAHKQQDEEGEETFTDITSMTAIAVWAMVASGMVMFPVKEVLPKERLLAFLKDEVKTYGSSWDTCKNVNAVLRRLDELASASLHTKEKERGCAVMSILT